MCQCDTFYLFLTPQKALHTVHRVNFKVCLSPRIGWQAGQTRKGLFCRMRNDPFMQICRKKTIFWIISVVASQAVRRNGQSVWAIEILVLELVHETFLANKNLVKSLRISALDKVIYYKGTFVQGSTKPLFTTQNRLEASWNKFAPFLNMCLLVLRFLWFEQQKLRCF
jgi:hypothetical protein